MLWQMVSCYDIAGHTMIIIVYSGVYFLCFTGFSHCYHVPCESMRSHTSQCGSQHNPVTCTWMFLLLCWGMNCLHANVTEAQKWEKINIQIQYNYIHVLSCYANYMVWHTWSCYDKNNIILWQIVSYHNIIVHNMTCHAATCWNILCHVMSL